MTQGDTAGAGQTVYFRLTAADVAEAEAAAARGGDVRFMVIDPAAAARHGAALTGAGVRQVVDKAHYRDGHFDKANQFVVEAGTRLSETLADVRRRIVAYFGDAHYAAVFDQAVIHARRRQHYNFYMLRRHCIDALERDPSLRLLVCVSDADRDLPWSTLESEGIAVCRRRGPRARLAAALEAAGAALLACVGPVADTAVLAAKMIRTGRTLGGGPLEPRVLYIGRFADENADNVKNQMFYRFDCLDPARTIYLSAATSHRLNRSMVGALERRGARFLSAGDLRFDVLRCLGRAVRYYTDVFPALFVAALGGRIDRAVLSELLSYVQSFEIANRVFDRVPVRFVVSDTETPPAVRVFAIEAKRRGLACAGVLHGAGVCWGVSSSRSNLQFSHLLMPGREHARLAAISPDVEAFEAVGNIESDIAMNEAGGFRALPEAARGRKIVLFAANIYLGVDEDGSMFGAYPYLGTEESDAFFESWMRPLANWIASDPGVFFLIKLKSPLYRVSRFKRLAAAFPENAVMDVTQHPYHTVVSAADLVITIPASSAGAIAMNLGIPVTTMDYLYGRVYDRYHPSMASDSGDALVENARWILENGLPADAFERFNRDHYGSARADGGSAGRIAASLERLSAPAFDGAAE